MKETTSLDRSELRKMQREQERERRRIRDRQRRQSMTAEQRERHLARRRRNYQLRRLRAENAKQQDSQSNQISNEEHDFEPQDEAEAGSSDFHEVTQLEKHATQPLQCLDAVASKSSNLTTKRLRLSHVRRLARSVNRIGSETLADHHIAAADVMTKGDANANNDTSCVQTGDSAYGRVQNGLRFNRVKRLARAVNNAASDASANVHQVEHNQSLEESQVISNDNPDSEKTSMPEVKFKDLTWTDKHAALANVES